MLRRNISSALAAILFTLAPLTAFAGGLPEVCGDIGPDVLSLLNRYAAMDPANFCIRSMTLAETRCWRQRDQVIRTANLISQRYNLAPVIPGCAPPLMAMVPAPVYVQPAPVYTAGARTAVAHGSDFDATWLLVGLGLLGIAGGAVLLTTCEGGGGGGTNTNSTSIDDEFNAQYTLKIIGAKTAYKRGFTGQGIVVGLIDTGLRITSTEFSGRVSADGGYDFTTNTQGMPTNEDLLHPHGTEVAGIIAANRNFVGMHGVAYNALIQPLRVFDVNGTPIDNFAGAINYATTSGTRILNGSYGPDDSWHTASETVGHQIIIGADLLEGQAYLSAAAQGSILVFPAGNSYNIAPNVSSNPTGPGFLPFIRPANSTLTSASGGAYRDINGSVINNDFSALEDNTIVVVGTDANGSILSYSNRCGVAKNWCMAAPAQNIFTTLDGVYTTVNGTSFAAPQVSGAAAILKQEFPSLTGPQIVAILLGTAKDLGTPGVDATYGHGMLDLAAATAPVGTTSVTLTSYTGGSSVSLQDTSLTFGAAFGLDVSEQLGKKELLFLDSYQRGYTTALSNVVDMQADSFRADQAVFGFDRPEPRQELKVGDRLSVGFTNESGSDNRFTSDQPRDPSDSRVNVSAFVVTDSITDTTNASLHYRDPNAMALGFSEADRARMDRGLVKANLQNPYAAFAANNGYASIIETPGLGGTVRVSGFFGRENGQQKADARNFGSQAEVAYKLDSDTKISLAFGALFENGSVLGTVGSGAFKLGNGTMTLYTGFGGSHKLDANTTLRGAAYAGWTKPQLASDSLITGMSSLVTTSFNMSIERRELAQKGDSFSFGVSQPLHVEGGNMQLLLPYARDDNSNEVFTSSLTQDLGGKGREIDLEAIYAFPVEDDTSFSFGGVYRHDAGHVAGKEDVLGVLRVTRKF